MHQYKSLNKNIVSVFLILIFVSALYVSIYIDENMVEIITQKAGVSGPILIVLFILLTQILAPLSGAPMIFVGIKLYGYTNAMIIFYFSSMISANINFFIARIYGRNVVRKLVGEKTLQEIDEISQNEENTLLIILRIFGYYFFDIISYAVGFTSIKYKKYMVYTAIISLIPMSVQYFAFRELNFNSITGIAIYYGSLVVTSILFTHYFYGRYVKGRVGK